MTRRVPSDVLVALQLGLVVALVGAVHWPVPPRAWPPTLFLLSVAVVLGVWTLGYNRWGNFNIRPELRPGARLVTGGPYRRIRHPMYASVLLGVGALVVADSRPWRIALLAALLVVLLLITMSSFREFDKIYSMTLGGPARATEVLGFLVYKVSFKDFHMGYGAALSFVMLVFILIVAIVYIRMMPDSE